MILTIRNGGFEECTPYGRNPVSRLEVILTPTWNTGSPMNGWSRNPVSRLEVILTEEFQTALMAEIESQSSISPGSDSDHLAAHLEDGGRITSRNPVSRLEVILTSQPPAPPAAAQTASQSSISPGSDSDFLDVCTDLISSLPEVAIQYLAWK